MERINNQELGRRDLAKQVLSWITCGKRPLKTAELQHALTVEVGDSDLYEADLLLIDEIVAVCAGLVTIDEESNIIRLVHFTTQEYFERTQIQWFPSAEQDITTICVTCLSFRQFSSGPCNNEHELQQRETSNPLYHYAARNWGHHARQASNPVSDAIGFLAKQPNVDASIQVLLARTWDCQIFPRQFTALHVAAYFGVDEVVRTLLEKSPERNYKDSDVRTPLSYAAENGYEAVVTQLITGKVDVDSKDKYGRTPLSYAAENGHEAVVMQLLAIGEVDDDSKDNHVRTPFSYAVENGDGAVAKQLLTTGEVDPNSTDKNGLTPLTYATVNSHETMITELLATNTTT
jgi:hypothetical protein